MRGVVLFDGVEIVGILLSYFRCRFLRLRKWTFLKNVVLWFVYMKFICYIGNRFIFFVLIRVSYLIELFI